MKKDFVKTPDGETHLMGEAGGGEHTLCGIAYDADSTEDDPSLKFLPVAAQAITCAQCALTILVCRGVKVSKRGAA